MSDIIKKAFENIDPEAEKRLDEKLKKSSESFGLYDVSDCDHDYEHINENWYKCKKCNYARPFNSVR